jgi:putative hydrolases of HD superfamily
MKEIELLRTYNKLKEVYRGGSIGNRKESTAEHSWGCLIVADYFMTKYYTDLDRVKVYEFLMYHDLVEIESGDVVLHPDVNRDDKDEKEKKAFEILVGKLPEPLASKYVKIFHEYEKRDSREAKFAKAVDCIESEMFYLDKKKEFKNWTKEFHINIRKKHLKDFPEMAEMLKKVIAYCEENGYYDQLD